MSDLTPPGAGQEPEAESPRELPKGGVSVDEWLAAHAGRTTTTQAPATPYGPPTSYDGPPPSRTMAGWSLGLSLLPCLVPLGQLTALGLSIAVLVKSRDGRDHGKGMALAGLIISLLVLLAIVAAIVIMAVSYWTNGWDETERDADGRVTEAGLVSIDRLRVDDCVEDLPTAEEMESVWATGEVRVVPCHDPHIAEVYAVDPIDPDDYDDQTSLDLASEVDCVREYKGYVGRPYRRSAYELHYYSPSVDGDSIPEDEVICLVTRPDGPSSNLIKGSAR